MTCGFRRPAACRCRLRTGLLLSVDVAHPVRRGGLQLAPRARILLALSIPIAAEYLPAAHVVVAVAASMRVLHEGGVVLLVHRTPPALVGLRVHAAFNG